MDGKKSGRGKVWYSGIDDDSLDVLVVEVEDLENDELSPKEAGFLYGYEEDYLEDDAEIAVDEEWN